MIKVIGKDPNVTKKATCRHCSSILEYLPIDVIEESRADYGGGSDIYKWIECPVCDKEVNV